mmetsp:Transcript_11704/g.16633  ORF Transcript_11704/g.16633 Transcript_11704/m.16633 type:complete len:90 (-) Transcript_11704:1240-1509(-)
MTPSNDKEHECIQECHERDSYLVGGHELSEWMSVPYFGGDDGNGYAQWQYERGGEQCRRLFGQTEFHGFEEFDIVGECRGETVGEQDEE